MRTTIDISDELYRQVKSQAALRGVRLRDLVEEGLRRVLVTPSVAESPRRIPFPLHRSQRPGSLSTEDVRRVQEQMLLNEDADHAGAV